MKGSISKRCQHLANTLRVSQLVAASLLDSLVGEGLVRQDGFPGRTLYTLASSLENEVIDYVRDKFVVPRYRLLSERRFVRVGRNLQIDAVLECEERMFLIEIRLVRSQAPTPQIEGGVRHLVRAASGFSQHTLGGYLVLIVLDPENYDTVKRQVERITLNADNLPVIVLPVLKDEVAGTAGS